MGETIFATIDDLRLANQIVAIGVTVDYLVFGRLDRRIKERRGLLTED